MWWCVLGAALAADDDDRKERLQLDFEFSDVLAGSLGATPGGAQDITSFRDAVAAGEVPLPEVFTAEGLFSAVKTCRSSPPAPATGSCARSSGRRTRAGPARTTPAGSPRSGSPPR